MNREHILKQIKKYPEDLEIVDENPKYILAKVLTYKGAVLATSRDIGGSLGRWAPGWRESDKYWKLYTEDRGSSFIVAVEIAPKADSKKYMIEMTKDEKIKIYDQADKDLTNQFDTKYERLVKCFAMGYAKRPGLQKLHEGENNDFSLSRLFGKTVKYGNMNPKCLITKEDGKDDHKLTWILMYAAENIGALINDNFYKSISFGDNDSPYEELSSKHVPKLEQQIKQLCNLKSVKININETHTEYDLPEISIEGDLNSIYNFILFNSFDGYEVTADGVYPETMATDALIDIDRLDIDTNVDIDTLIQASFYLHTGAERRVKEISEDVPTEDIDRYEDLAYDA